MVRKQLYLDEAQEMALKQRAKELGVSEAEIVRRALDEALGVKELSPAVKRRNELLQAIFDDADRHADMLRAPDDYRFDRQGLYEEEDRFTRWKKHE